MRRQGFLVGAAVSVAIAFASSAASASVVFIDKNSPQSQEQNILFGTAQTGTTVTGTTNQSDTLVEFSTTTGQTLFTNSSGQAKIETSDNGGFLTSVMVDVPGHTFQDFIVNLNDLQTDATISVVTNDGTFTHTLSPGSGSGQNFITLFAESGETISSVTYTSTGGFGQFQQPRISGISGVTVVPELSTWAMMFVGFAGLGYVGSRGRRVQNRLALHLD